MKICGIDESGRGPVIGPLVMCGVLTDEKGEEKLKKIGAKDSKLLTAKQRERLAKKIEKIAKYKIVKTEPKEIDHAVGKNDGLNLNWLEARKTAEIINELKPDKAILDCPSPNIKAYVRYLKKHLKNKKTEIIAEHKAERYPVVAAASIIAKVTRDSCVEQIKRQIGNDFGSGYASDPKTQEFLKNNITKHRELFRKSWISYKKAVNKKLQRKLGDF